MGPITRSDELQCYRQRVLPRFLRPGWLVGHALIAIFVIITGWLGWWQLDKALSSSGSGLNLGYALQWPLFGVFAIAAWIRFLRMETQRVIDLDTPEQALAEPTITPEPKWLPARPVSASGQSEEPELAAYNRYLKNLAQQNKTASRVASKGEQ